MKYFLSCCIVGLVFFNLSFAQRDLLDSKVRDLLTQEFSGSLAKEHVIQLTRHNRIQGSRQFRTAAQYVLSQLRSFGVNEKDAYIESFTSDGKTAYQTWQSPSGWDIESAELRMVEPFEESIVRYPEIGMSVITYSNTGDITAELVDVGGGTNDKDYDGKDVKGRMVLATGYGGQVHRKAVLKYGARAVVSFLDSDKGREHRDLVQYTGMWPKSNELDRVTFGFNISNRQGTKLKELLKSGQKVVLHGKVKGAGLEPYFMDVVVAHIRGSEKPDEELVFTAHLDHPKESANDNASGSSAQLDIVRSLKKLIEEKKLPRPKRSLRFIWIPEFYGTMAYIDKHPELMGPALGGKVLASINMDMVGAHLEMIHSVLLITRTPHSVPSVLNDVVDNMITMVDNMEIREPRASKTVFNWRFIPYMGASDHMMLLDRKIPAMMLFHYDYVGHTSHDTPETIDPLELERCALVAAGSMWYLANLTEPEALDLVQHCYAGASQRLGEAAREAFNQLVTAKDAVLSSVLREAKNTLEHITRYESEGLASTLTYTSSHSVKQRLDWLRGRLLSESNSTMLKLEETATSRNVVMSAERMQGDVRVPLRTTRGPLDLELPQCKLPEAEAAAYKSPDFPLGESARFELVNFVDGKMTVSEIRNALSAEYGPLELEVVAKYFNDLVRIGVIRWK